MDQTELTNKIDAYLEKNWDAMVDDIATLVRIPSFQEDDKKADGAPFGPGPKKALEAALELAGGMGFKTHDAEGYIGFADFPGASDTQLGIIGHMVVVPAGPGWTFEPYEVTRKDGYLVGRGTLDDKGPSVMALHAMKFWKDLQDEGEAPQFGPCARLDYELELGIFVGTGNAQGDRIALADADAHVFGLCILNDWSARDIQAWEYQPLGPFLAKNFASTISPWIVTLEALEPFRTQWNRGPSEPQPLPYLASDANRAKGAYDVRMEVLLTTEQSRASKQAPARLSGSNFRDAYWNVAQLITHHTVNGCNLQPGDMLGTGTLSGPQPSEAGSLLELNHGGKNPIELPWGEKRTFLQDGDQVIMRAECVKAGYPRIGFGECSGTVLPARV